jgi:predicted RNA-binding protein with PUA-like domain
MKHWLIKSEPDAYSIDDLIKDGKTPWDGIRNYQARNLMRDEMEIGDLALFYHSNAKPPGVVGIAKVVSEIYPDITAWDPKSKYFYKRSTPEKPVWELRDFAFVEKFPRLVSLAELREHEELANMLLLKKGMRLSIQPVAKSCFDYISTLARSPSRC